MTETTVATEHVSATERLEDEAPRADARRLGDRTRIVIADDHTIMREGLRSLLEAEPGLELDLDSIFDPGYYTRHVPEVLARLEEIPRD